MRNQTTITFLLVVTLVDARWPSEMDDNFFIS